MTKWKKPSKLFLSFQAKVFQLRGLENLVLKMSSEGLGEDTAVNQFLNDAPGLLLQGVFPEHFSQQWPSLRVTGHVTHATLAETDSALCDHMSIHDTL